MPNTTNNTFSPGEIGEHLRSFIGPARILTRPIDRVAFASDASLYRLVPRAVVQPISTEEVRQIFRYSREKRVPLPNALRGRKGSSATLQSLFSLENPHITVLPAAPFSSALVVPFHFALDREPDRTILRSLSALPAT